MLWKIWFANQKFGVSGVFCDGTISLIAKRISVLQQCSSAIEWLQDIVCIAFWFSTYENFVRKIMAALEASWVLNHVNLASYKLVSYKKERNICNILYTICNEAADVLNIVLIRKRKRLSIS